MTPTSPSRKRSLPPLDLGEEARHLDRSGTPAALIEIARDSGDLAFLDDLPQRDVLVEYPMGKRWREQTGYDRFVRLRTPIDGKRYALVRPR